MAVAIALCLTDGLGSVRLNGILRQLEARESEMSSLANYSTRNLVDQLGFSSLQAQTFAAFAPRGRHLASLLEDRGGYVVTALEPGFPRRLHDRYATRGPALLFVRGDAGLLSTPAVAIGGSRNAFDLSLRATIDAVRITVETGKVVVSGGARGVDIVAHEAALDAGGRTVVVLPQGLLTYSPPPSIAAGLDEGRVAIVSEFPPDLPWSTYAAMQRNRTVVAEAGTSGGTKAAADGALGAKIPTGVFAFPEPSMAEGNRALIARGGVPIPVTGDGSVDRDALTALPMSSAGPSGPIQSSLFEPRRESNGCQRIADWIPCGSSSPAPPNRKDSPRVTHPNSHRHRIGIGGIAIESSTFSPHISTDADFTIQRSDEITASYPYFQNGTFEGRGDIDWFPTFKARSIPGGPVAAETYGRFKRELLDRLRAALPLDGFFFDIHGAMSVVGMDDAEGDLATAIREVVGPGCVISAGMDLHGNVSDQLVGAVDIFTAYRQAPHVDAMETKARAVRLLLTLIDEGIRPHRAFVRIPVNLPGERTSTFWEPGKTVYGKLRESDVIAGVLDASLWVGYVWADQPRANATTVVTGTDPVAIAREAEKIARRYWTARHAFDFDRKSGTAVETIEWALALNQKSVIVSDSGDNPTAGGAGDMTHFAAALLTYPDLANGTRTAVAASIPGPEAVAAAKAAGVGAEVAVTVGGVLDPVNGEPLTFTGTVHSLLESDPIGGDVAVLRQGGVHLIVTSRRRPYHRIADFQALDVDPADHDITVVKIGYLEPDLRRAASASFIALTPGAVNQDIASLPFKRVERPVFPLDPDMPDPDLTARVFPPIDRR